MPKDVRPRLGPATATAQTLGMALACRDAGRPGEDVVPAYLAVDLELLDASHLAASGVSAYASARFDGEGDGRAERGEGFFQRLSISAWSVGYIATRRRRIRGDSTELEPRECALLVLVRRMDGVFGRAGSQGSTPLAHLGGWSTTVDRLYYYVLCTHVSHDT